jgi:hypothetical protein
MPLLFFDLNHGGNRRRRVLNEAVGNRSAVVAEQVLETGEILP